MDNIIKPEGVEDTTSEQNNEEESKEETTEESGAEQPEDNEEKSEEESEEVDYAGELEKLENEKKHNQEGYKMRKQEKDLKSDKISRVIEEKVAEESQRILATVQQSQLVAEIRNISRNEDEEKLTKWHYENSIKPTGDVSEDVKKANTLANSIRNAEELHEAKRAAASERNKSFPSGSGQKEQHQEDVKLTKEEKRLVERFGVKEDTIAKAKAQGVEGVTQ